MTTTAQWLTAQLQSGGLSPAEAAAVLTIVESAPTFQWSAWIWAADATTIANQSQAILWGVTCWYVVQLIDVNEPGHWSRPFFSSQVITPLRTA